LDLRLGPRAVRIRAGFLPARATVSEGLDDLTLHELDLDAGAVLEPGRIYLVPLLEELALPEDVRGRLNPKSSTGRLDLFTRVITDRNARFDWVPPGARGPLWLEVVPRSFPVRVRTGQRLNQIRFVRGAARLTDAEHLEAHHEHGLIRLPDGSPPPDAEVDVESGFYLRLALKGSRPDDVVGYRARRYTGVVDLDRVDGHDPADYFTPITCPDGRLVLEPEEFYIFASRERIRIPPGLAAEMSAYDVGIGELRTNYAGFFDAGFGWSADGTSPGTPAVLEVRAHDVPFVIEDGQVFFRLEFSRTTRPCRELYGGKGSHYGEQGVTLAKQFRRR
ncbi:MAG: 2'-deoxycytidine 5'-triphosphate deaminase, partial [Planctomycetota bacterium JB042]